MGEGKKRIEQSPNNKKKMNKSFNNLLCLHTLDMHSNLTFKKFQLCSSGRNSKLGIYCDIFVYIIPCVCV